MNIILFFFYSYNHVKITRINFSEIQISKKIIVQERYARECSSAREKNGRRKAKVYFE